MEKARSQVTNKSVNTLDAGNRKQKVDKNGVKNFVCIGLNLKSHLYFYKFKNMLINKSIN